MQKPSNHVSKVDQRPGSGNAGNATRADGDTSQHALMDS